MNCFTRRRNSFVTFFIINAIDCLTNSYASISARRLTVFIFHSLDLTNLLSLSFTFFNSLSCLATRLSRECELPNFDALSFKPTLYKFFVLLRSSIFVVRPLLILWGLPRLYWRLPLLTLSRLNSGCLWSLLLLTRFHTLAGLPSPSEEVSSSIWFTSGKLKSEATFVTLSRGCRVPSRFITLLLGFESLFGLNTSEILLWRVSVSVSLFLHGSGDSTDEFLFKSQKGRTVGWTIP